MAFPSQQSINLSPTKMMDPFSGAKGIEIELPKLNDFLKITQLSSYAGKLKKLKCAETEDLINIAAPVGFSNVEEQRVRRYLDHFYQGVLVEAEKTQKPQPITLDNFFELSNLNHVSKSIRKYGVVEFDDLQWIAHSGLVTMLLKKVEVERLKRYCDRVANASDLQTASDTLKTFIIEAQLKSFKGTFEKLGVVETDDLIFVDRSDLPKMKQVEYERFERYREKFAKRTQDRISSTPQPNSPTNNLQQVPTDVTQDRRISNTQQPNNPTNNLQQVPTDVTQDERTSSTQQPNNPTNNLQQVPTDVTQGGSTSSTPQPNSPTNNLQQVPTDVTQDESTSSTPQPNSPTNNLQQVSTDVTQDRRTSSTQQPNSPTNNLQQVPTDVTQFDQHAPYPVELSQSQPNLVNPGQLPHYPMPNQQPQQFIPHVTQRQFQPLSQVFPPYPQSQPFSSPQQPPILSPCLRSPDQQHPQQFIPPVFSSTQQPNSPTNNLQQVPTDVTQFDQHAPYPVELSQSQPNLVNPGQLPHYPMPNQQPQQFIPPVTQRQFQPLPLVLPPYPQSQPFVSPQQPPILSPDQQQQTYDKQNPPPVRRKTWQNSPRPSETFLFQERSFDAGHSYHNLVHQNTYPSPQKAFNPSYG